MNEYLCNVITLLVSGAVIAAIARHADTRYEQKLIARAAKKLIDS